MKLKIGKVENRTIEVEKQVKRDTGGRPVEQLRHMVDSLEVGQCFSVEIPSDAEKTKIRDRLSSTRTNVMRSKKCRFSIRLEGGTKYTIYRVE